jgi:hypothetical protein
MYSKAACRDGMRLAWSKETDPSQRLRITIEACRDAYCPELDVPKPALCTSRSENVELPAWFAQWKEFDRIILERDLGAELASRVFAARDAYAAGKVAAKP